MRGRRRTRTPVAIGAALRLGRRLAFAKVGRAVLIVSLIGVPTAGFAAGAVVIQSTLPTVQEQLRYDLGHAAAQMRLSGPDVPGMRQDPVQWQLTDSARDSPVTTADEDSPWAELLDHVPEGADAITVRTTQVVVRGPEVPVAVTADEGATWSPALDGHWHVLSGRAPAAPDEAMATPATLERLHVSVGDAITVTDPVRERFTVTGTMRDAATGPDAEGVFLPSGSLPADLPASFPRDGTDTTVYLPDVAPTWSEIRALNAHGIVVESRPVVLDPPSDRLEGAPTGTTVDAYLGAMALVGVFAAFEVALLAGAAFLVGTRADTRTHAIVTSVGGGRGFVRAVVAGSGLVLGVTGALLGTALGTGLGVLAFRLLDDGNVGTWPGLHVPGLAIVTIAAAAVVAGLVAALVAARAATRIDVLAALRGSLRPAVPRPRAERRRRTWVPVLVVTGAVMTLACGAGVLLLNDRPVQQDRWAVLVGVGVAIGPCLVQLGVALASPWVLAGLARLSARLGLSARIAARDARRNPVRTVPVLASVMSVVFVASVVITWSASEHARFVRGYEYTTAVGVATANVSLTDRDGYSDGYDAAVTDRAARVLSGALDGVRLHVLAVNREDTGKGPTTITTPHDFVQRDCPTSDTTGCATFLQSVGSGEPHIVAGTVDDYALLTGHRPSAEVRRALADGEAVSLWPEYVHDGAVRIDTFRNRTIDDPTSLGATSPDTSTTIPAVLDVQTPRIKVGVFMTRETAAATAVPLVDGMLAMHLSQELTPAQYDELSSAWQSGGGADRERWGGPGFVYERGPVDEQATVQALVLALAAAVTIGATAVAVGLARSDGRRDDEVLDAIGAEPVLRRRVSAWQAAILTTVGAVVGTLLGLLPIRALTLRFDAGPTGTTHLPFVADWPVLALLALGLPLVVTAGTWLTAGRGRRVAVRRAH
ncbi:hypothetical protein [Curtobacterium sp. TXMA1]|uniref:hypothetical protein n=1 Tax=Curtobacterium sp. TXMA1 TaxID=2876939 RepID=UPI001CCDDFD7|nr:hypothetical protein [Curtobacterium sp. TXMA1]UBQ02486.1 hypothetical protein LCG91_15790 [Curtobacterium sp. TXMA1]